MGFETSADVIFGLQLAEDKDEMMAQFIKMDPSFECPKDQYPLDAFCYKHEVISETDGGEGIGSRSYIGIGLGHATGYGGCSFNAIAMDPTVVDKLEILGKRIEQAPTWWVCSSYW